VERTYLVSACEASIRFVGQSQTPIVVQFRDDGVDVRIDAADPLEVRCHHITSGDRACADQPGSLARTGEAD
jgi:hypothetical protein